MLTPRNAAASNARVYPTWGTRLENLLPMCASSGVAFSVRCQPLRGIPVTRLFWKEFHVPAEPVIFSRALRTDTDSFAGRRRRDPLLNRRAQARSSPPNFPDRSIRFYKSRAVSHSRICYYVGLNQLETCHGDSGPSSSTPQAGRSRELGPTVPVSRQAGGQMSCAVGRRST